MTSAGPQWRHAGWAFADAGPSTPISARPPGRRPNEAGGRRRGAPAAQAIRFAAAVAFSWACPPCPFRLERIERYVPVIGRRDRKTPSIRRIIDISNRNTFSKSISVYVYVISRVTRLLLWRLLYCTAFQCDNYAHSTESLISHSRVFSAPVETTLAFQSFMLN